MMSLWQDLRYGFRIFSRNPGFALVAVIALALGIGANATVFAVANPIFFKNLPFEGSADLLFLSTIDPASPGLASGISRPDYDDFRASLKSFPSIGAARRGSANLSDTVAVPEFHSVARMSANAFSVLGQKPALGRDFNAQDEKPGAAPVAILTWRLWEQRYAKNPAVLGQTIRLDSLPTAVIGVMPKYLEFPPEAELWTNLTPSGKETREERALTVFGKLAAGTTLASARAELRLLGQRIASQHSAENKGNTYEWKRFHDIALQGGVSRVIVLLLGAVGFVLLIACANVANLLLSRAAGRAREISIRTALGAQRIRIVRQLLAESLLLALAGGLGGWGLSIFGVRAFDAAVANTGKPAWIDFSADYHSLAWLAATTLLTAVLFGLAPALRLSKVNLNATLKDGARGAGHSIRGRYLTGALVTVQMTLSVVLLISAGLMIRSFLSAFSRPLGVDTSNVLTLRMELPQNRYSTPERRQQFQDRLGERVRALPGVEAVTFAGSKQSTGFSERYQAEGSPADPKQLPRSQFLIAGDHYFETLRLRAARGRLLTSTEFAPGPAVAVLNQTLARQMWPNQDPVGKRFRLHPDTGPSDWTTVVGVVDDFLPDLQNGEPQPSAVIPFRQHPDGAITLLARTAGPAALMANPVRRQIQLIDPDLPAHDVNTLDEEIAQNRWPLRVFGAMFAAFAVIALLLATVGLYAVVAYSVSLRRQEIGVRVTLGASTFGIARMVLLSGARQAGLGLGLGLVAAIGVARLLKTILVGVAPNDPVTFVTTGVILLIATAAGCLLPAWRAARVDPVVALRGE